MVAIARSSSSATAPARVSARIERILRTTAQHFSIPALPDLALALPEGEFKDPLPYRWVDTHRSAHLLPRAKASAFL